jgi:hypothetical protein
MEPTVLATVIQQVNLLSVTVQFQPATTKSQLN